MTNRQQSWDEVRESTGMTDNDYMRKFYPTIPTQQLQGILHRTLQAIHKQAQALTIKRATLKTEIIPFLAKGFKVQMLRGEASSRNSDKIIRRAADELVAEGRAVKVEVSYKNVIYYADASAASAARSKVQPSMGVTIRRKNSVGWGPDDPAHTTEKTKRTYGKPLPEKVFWTNTHPRY